MWVRSSLQISLTVTGAPGLVYAVRHQPGQKHRRTAV